MTQDVYLKKKHYRWKDREDAIGLSNKVRFVVNRVFNNFNFNKLAPKSLNLCKRRLKRMKAR